MSNNASDRPMGLLDAMSEWGKATHPAANGISTVPPPPPPPSLLDALSKYLTRPVAQGMYYNGKIVNLNGFKFSGCRFDNCKLIVETTNFELENCIIDPSTVIEYSAETVKVIRLFNNANEWTHTSMPGFAPRKNADGSITVDSAQQ